MPTTEVTTGIVSGCEVTAQGTPNTTAAVAAGFVIVNGTVAAVAAGNVTPGVADATGDRVDVVVADSTGALSVVAGTVADGANAVAPTIDDTVYAVLKLVLVVGQASPSYTDTITSSALVNTDGATATTVVYQQLPEPANTMAFTFLNSAQSGDPGAGKIGFDTTALNTLTTLYVNYLSPSWGSVSGTGGYTKLIDWLLAPLNGRTIGVVTPFYLRLWSRKQPNKFVVVKVTAAVDHTTYAALTVSEWTCTQPDVGVFGTSIPLNTDTADTILQFDGAVATSPTATNGTAALTSGDVTMTTLNTFYDGPSLASIGASGQKLLFVGQVQVVAPNSIGKCTARLWDGTTVLAEQEFNFAANSTFSIGLTALVSPSAAATYKISCANTVNGGTIKRQTPDNSAGGTVYTASQLSYVQVA